MQTVESTLALDVDVVLDRMRVASKGRLATHRHSSGQAAAFGALARDLIGRHQTTTDGIIAAAGHAEHVDWIARSGRPLTLERLIAADGKVLVELLTGAEVCEACGGSPLTGRNTDDAPADERALFNAEIERQRAAYRATPAAEGTS